MEYFLELIVRLKPVWLLLSLSKISYSVVVFLDFKVFFKIFGIRDFLPSDDILHWMATYVCEPTDLRVFCSSVIFLISGFDVPQLNMVR